MRFFKYRCWNDNTKLMINSNTIRFTRICELNDPFEGDFTTSEDFVLKDIVRTKINDGDNRSPETILRELKSRSNKDYDEVREILSDLRYLLKRNHFIFSSSVELKDIVMWSHYSDHHKGVVLEFESEGFLNESEINSGFTIKKIDNQYLHKVEYENKKLEIINSEPDSYGYHKILLQKSIQWSYEKEYRIILNSRMPKSGGLNISYNREKLIAIYIGALMPETKRNEVYSNAEKLNIKCYDMLMLHGQFSLKPMLVG